MKPAVVKSLSETQIEVVDLEWNLEEKIKRTEEFEKEHNIGQDLEK